MLFADRTSCHRFVANQFRVLLAAAAYVLVSHLRRVGLAGTEHATATVQTIRLKLIKVGGMGAEVGASLGGADVGRLSVGRSVRVGGPSAIGTSVRREFVAGREIEWECPGQPWGKGGGSDGTPFRGIEGRKPVNDPAPTASEISVKDAG